MTTKEITSGNLRQLWRVTFPLMISSLSLFTMLFVDRLFLARYSTEALNAASYVGTLCWAILFAITTLPMMAEVFIAQYNGAKQYQELGTFVWQMIWLSAFSIIFFLPAGLWGASAIYTDPFAVAYAEWFMYTSPLFVLLNALTAFYIGQGKTSIVRWLAIIGNVVNCVLDPILIFGIDGIVPSMGIKGALIATGIGGGIQCLIFLVFFLSKVNRETFGTARWHFKWPLFKACLKVGFPTALSNFWELLGWSAFYWMMAQISQEHILTASIAQSILFFFLFFGFGLEKGVSTVAGNLIGAKKIDKLPEVIWSGVKLVGIYALILFFFFILYPDVLLDPFFNQAHLVQETRVGADTFLMMALIAKVKGAVKWAMVMMAIYLTLENVRWILGGILVAAGDTLFIMIASVASVWIGLILPTYLFVMRPTANIKIAFIIWVAYSVCSTLIFFIRYLHGKWKDKRLVEEPTPVRIPIEEKEKSLS